MCAATLPPVQALGDRCVSGRRSYARRKPEESVLYQVVQPRGCASEIAHDAGHRLFLATSKPHVYATRILDHFGVARVFSGVYGSELDGRRDDKSELIAHLLECEGLAAADCRMFGDRLHDVIGAAKNGVETVGVTWGYGSHDELTTAGALVLCHAPRDLPPHF